MTNTELVRAGNALEKLPSDSNVQGWTPPQRALMQQLGLIDRKSWKGPQPDAPAGVVEAFLMQCQRTRLDPAARQIYAAEMGGKWTVLISIDGFRLIADRTGLYLGKQPTLWCGPDGVWRDVWLSDEPPAAAKIAVMRAGFTEPLVAVATYAGYCPRDGKTGELKPSGQWKSNASNQLAKCAEMLALRQAFPNELSGLYGTEEMDQAKASRVESARARTVEAAPVVQAVSIATPEPSRDWPAAIEGVESLEAAAALYREAEAAGELGLVVGLAGDKDDGSADTVMDLFWARRRELESRPEPLVDVPKSKRVKRQWLSEAKAAETVEALRAVWQEASASGASADLLDEIDALEASLPEVAKETAGGGWASPDVVEPSWDDVVGSSEGPMALGGDES